MRGLVATLLILAGPIRLMPGAVCPLDISGDRPSRLADASPVTEHHDHGASRGSVTAEHDAGAPVPEGAPVPSGCRMHVTCGLSLTVGAPRLASGAAVWHTTAPPFAAIATVPDLSKDPPPPRLSA